MAKRAQLITIFSCPKAFSGHDAIIQTNALRNWRSLGIDIILMGDDPGVCEAAKEYGCLYIPELQKTEYGTPLLSDIFTKAQEACKTPLICYSNADIMFPSSLISAAEIVAEKFPQFLVSGQRWDADIKELLDIHDTWDSTIQTIQKTATLHAPWGMDYFLFPRGMITMPAFAIGRPAWDNWMIWQTYSKKIPLIDGTASISIIHQNHGYAHVPGKISYNWSQSPESEANRKLATKLCPWLDMNLLTIKLSNYLLTETLEITTNPNKTKSRGLLLLHIPIVLYRSVFINKFNLPGRIKVFIRTCLGETFYGHLKQAYHNCKKCLKNKKGNI